MSKTRKEFIMKRITRFTAILCFICISFTFTAQTVQAAITEQYYIYCQIKPYVDTKGVFGWKTTLKVKDQVLAKYLYIWKKDAVWVDSFLKGNFTGFTLTEGPTLTHSSYLTNNTYFQNFADAWTFGNDWIMFAANFIRQTTGKTVSIYFPEIMFIDNKGKAYDPPDSADFLCSDSSGADPTYLPEMHHYTDQTEPIYWLMTTWGACIEVNANGSPADSDICGNQWDCNNKLPIPGQPGYKGCVNSYDLK